MVDGHEGRLAAHGQAHVAGGQVGIDARAEGADRLPLRVAVGPGDARRLPFAVDAHLVAERAFGLFDQAADRRRRGRLRTARQGDVALAGEQPAGRVEADPAGAGQVHLAPGVQVGEVDVGAGRAVEGLHVGGQLDQVAGHEARGEAQVAQQLDQQPAAVAARAGGLGQGFLGALHAGLEADQVADVLAQALVEGDQEVDGRRRRALDARQVVGETRLGAVLDQVRRQLALFGVGVGEGNLFRIGLEEEVERVEHRHLGDQVDLDLQFAGLLREHQARQVIALRVLLPVDEVFAGRHLERVGEDARAAVRRRTQADDLRAEADRAIVAIVADMVQRDMNGHSKPPASLGDEQGRARLMPARRAGFAGAVPTIRHRNGARPALVRPVCTEMVRWGDGMVTG
ncbi:hypothetical protein FQZ97_608780 [compost metagenome]